MDGTINIPISMKVFMELSDFLDGCRSNEKFTDVADKAIRAWIAQQSAPPVEEPIALLGGYQWKHLFLPAGTKLRIVVNRHTYNAQVIGDQIIQDGIATSPARLVNRLAATKRNAWKHIWYLIPGATQWQHANATRQRQP